MNNFCPFINGTCRSDCQFARQAAAIPFGTTVVCALDRLSDKMDAIIIHLSKSKGA